MRRAKAPWLVLGAALAAIPAAAPAAPPVCDDARAVAIVRVAAAREKRDLSTLQLVVEGPFGRAKFARTHPTFRLAPAVAQRLGKRTFYFVWFHPSFSQAYGDRGADVWGLVDASRCDLLHLAREP
jgi:hypothetical protein